MGVPTEKIWERVDAVSYTHLDVYKRQMHTRKQKEEFPSLDSVKEKLQEK